MKTKFKILMLCMIAIIMACNENDNVPSSNSSCLTGTLADGVIAFYSFSNGSLNDLSGNGRNLTAVGTYSSTTDRTGNANCAVSIINEDNNGDIPTTGTGTLPQLANQRNFFQLANFNTTVKSISVWYQPKGLNYPANYSVVPVVLEHGRSIGGYEGLVVGSNIVPASISVADTCGEWSLGLYDCRRVNVGVKLGTGSYWEEISGGCDTFINAMESQWKHIVIINNGSNLSLYVNGVYQSPQIPYSFDSVGNFGATVSDLLIGYGFKGSLDDLILYDRALTTTEVAQLYAMGGCCAQ